MTASANNGGLYPASWAGNSGEGSSLYLRIPVQEEQLYRNTPLTDNYISCSFLAVLGGIARLEKLSLESGDGEIESPSAASIEAGRRIARHLDFYNLSPSRISNSAEGGIALAFYHGHRFAGIEVLNDASVTAITSDYAGKIEAWDVDLMNLKGTADRIREHLEA
jgi:hypothetical protein